MLVSASFFAVQVIVPNHGIVTLIAQRFGGQYCLTPPSGRCMVRAGEAEVRLHNHDGFACPARQDTEVEMRLSPDVARVSHTFRAATV